MFENIPAAPADPILGLADLFRADARTNKINLGIGVYKDETGKTPVLTSVKKLSSICWKTKPRKLSEHRWYSCFRDLHAGITVW